MAGEVGELCNLLKKRHRWLNGAPNPSEKEPPTVEACAKEAGDIVAYLDLLCARMGIDLGAAVRSKFNEVSKRMGFPDFVLPEVKEDLPPEYDKVMSDVVKKGDHPSIQAALDLHAKMAKTEKPPSLDNIVYRYHALPYSERAKIEIEFGVFDECRGTRFEHERSNILFAKVKEVDGLARLAKMVEAWELSNAREKVCLKCKGTGRVLKVLERSNPVTETTERVASGWTDCECVMQKRMSQIVELSDRAYKKYAGPGRIAKSLPAEEARGEDAEAIRAQHPDQQIALDIEKTCPKCHESYDFHVGDEVTTICPAPKEPLKPEPIMDKDDAVRRCGKCYAPIVLTRALNCGYCKDKMGEFYCGRYCVTRHIIDAHPEKYDLPDDHMDLERGCAPKKS